MKDLVRNPLLRDANKLLYFFLAIQRGSIRSAAKSVGVSQPSFSRSLKEFEERLGVKLMLRGQKGVRLTPAGTRLFDFASEFVTSAVGTYGELSGVIRRPIRFGTHEVLFGSILGALDSGVYLEIVESSPFVTELARKVADGEIDAALVVESPALRNPRLFVDRIIEDHYSVFCLAGQRGKTRKLPVAYFPRSIAAPTKRLDEIFEEAGISASRSIHLSSLDAVKTMVMRGRAIGILPDFCVTHELESRQVARVKLDGFGVLRAMTRHQLCFVTRVEERKLGAHRELRDRLKVLGARTRKS